MNTSLKNRGFGIAALLCVALPAFAQTPPPAVIKGKLAEWVGAGHALYKVDSYESGLKDYRQKYNQGGRVIHPGYSKDRLAVVELEIRNVTDHPILPPVFMPALTDTDGVRTTDWKLDSRQISFVTEHPRDVREDSSSPAEIAAGQIMKVTLIFSISPKARPTALEFSPDNFRVFSFGSRPPRPAPMDGTPPPTRQFGPRTPAARPIPRDAVRVYIDLTVPTTMAKP